MRVAVRTLVEYACRTGDIHFRFDESTEGHEGIATQRRIQKGRGDRYEREVSVATTWQRGAGEILELAGRIDGLDRSGPEPVIEEFKTTRENPERLHAHAGALHFAQARLYAAILARVEPVPAWRLRVVYCHPETAAVTVYEERASAQDLESFLDDVCMRYALALARLRRHRRQRNRALAVLDFPFTSMRTAQRRLARAVYRAVRDGSSVLAEAPTGSGKTLGTLFPALRAIGAGHADRVVFLSARGTGQRAAEDAVNQLSKQPLRLRAITITAKHRICFKPEPICDPAVCEFANGYYDRLPHALKGLFEGPSLNRDAIEAVARAHRVCPFELSLDAAVWSDVVFCDYNYVFDPVVRLKRLRGVTADRAALLVDEAHQLADRVRDALSARLDRSALTAALAEGVGADLARAIRSLDRQLITWRRDLIPRPARNADFERLLPALPKGLEKRIDDILSHLGMRGPEHHAGAAAITQFGYSLMRFKRVIDWFDENYFTAILSGASRELSIALRCFDPSAHIQRVLGEFPTHVRFSGTLTPLSLFTRLHGITDARTLRLPSPFPADRLGVLIVPDVSARYRARAQSLEQMVLLIETLVGAREGNYLIAFPSFAYLHAVAVRFTARNPQRLTACQDRDMDAAARESFLARFSAGGEPVIGFIVMGGVFAESVDLPGDRLIGMAVIGIGLPPPSAERDRQAEALGDVGYLAAYQYPAMTKVIQAGGRLIRNESDRGVLCLVDDRFLHAGYRALLPDHWQPQVVRSEALGQRLDAFWNTG